jgi:hypothetical protein
MACGTKKTNNAREIERAACSSALLCVLRWMSPAFDPADEASNEPVHTSSSWSKLTTGQWRGL